MRTNDPMFRSVMANVEKASTGEELRSALADYDNTPPAKTLDSAGQEVGPTLYRYHGALATTYLSHRANMNETDPEFFIPPVIGPGDKLIDFGDYEYVDQDGNPVQF